MNQPLKATTVPVTRAPARRRGAAGFTLIEMSIVLVIIGLIVGGILVGQNLIAAAGVRATIAQIEKYNTAANTFRDKYGYLPGDIPAGPAAQFGFAARGSYPGEGDGNGIIQSVYANCVCATGVYEWAGETLMFWVDLSAARLISGGFNNASSTTAPSGAVTLTSTPGIGAFLPAAMVGQGNYIYVWSGGIMTGNATNYFGLSSVTSLASYFDVPASTTSLTVQQAYSIDGKIDDGLPQSGRVMAQYLNSIPSAGSAMWAGSGVISGPFTTATPGSSTTCFDNGNAAGAPQQYSLEQNGGAGMNCALSFQFQ